MRQRGTLIKWNGEKGFGFIAPEGGGADVFLHIKALGGWQARPTVGATISYEPVADRLGRARATRAAIESGRWFRLPHLDFSAQLLITLAASFLAALTLNSWLGRLSAAIPTAYIITSVFTAAVYRSDKWRAVRQQWRTPEGTLHLLSLLGGWPGALIAQQDLRHKTAKLSFQLRFWPIVLAHLLVWAWAIPVLKSGRRSEAASILAHTSLPAPAPHIDLSVPIPATPITFIVQPTTPAPRTATPLPKRSRTATPSRNAKH